MSEHTGRGGDYYAQSYQEPTAYTSSTGRREVGVSPYSSGAAKIESSNFANLRDAGNYRSASDMAKSDPVGTFVKGATMSWVDELQNAPPWLMEAKNLYQEIQGMTLAHGAGHFIGGRFGHTAGRVSRQFIHRAYRSHVRKQPVHASWAKAFHKH